MSINGEDVGAFRTDAEDVLRAERAAEWLLRLPTASRAEREEFVRWLRASPLHVREMLLAICCDEILHRIDPDRRIDIDELTRSVADNIVSLPLDHS